MTFAYSIGATLLAYLLGSLSFAVIVSRLFGLRDPRSYGSKNPGATNVLRSGNKAAAVSTLLLDGLKGWLPVVLVRWLVRPRSVRWRVRAVAVPHLLVAGNFGMTRVRRFLRRHRRVLVNS